MGLNRGFIRVIRVAELVSLKGPQGRPKSAQGNALGNEV